MYKLQKDQYRRSRGGTSHALDITCEHCNSHIAYYQKDGPGLLKRMYVDRFIDSHPDGDQLHCPSCQQHLGTKINYKKEDRPAYRMFVGSVNKKIISVNELP